MKMNSDALIETARKVYRLFDGDWEKARKSATLDEDGVWIIPKPPVKQSAKRKTHTSAA
ncbi:MAG: hypothetical protein ACRCY3_11495 [Sphingorhabdus sp.]